MITGIPDDYPVADLPAWTRSLQQMMVETFYWVGRIICTGTNVNPGTYIPGTTWTPIAAGRTLVGVHADNPLFATAGETGGLASVTLTAAQSGLRDHAHRMQHRHNFQHRHQFRHHHHITSFDTDNGGVHAHSASTNSAGNHTHTIPGSRGTETSGGATAGPPGSSSFTAGTTGQAGAHTHSVTINNGGEHRHNVPSHNTGDPNSWETDWIHPDRDDHTLTAWSSSDNTDSVGAANASEAHTNLQPYLVVHYWQRTA